MQNNPITWTARDGSRHAGHWTSIFDNLIYLADDSVLALIAGGPVASAEYVDQFGVPRHWQDKAVKKTAGDKIHSLALYRSKWRRDNIDRELLREKYQRAGMTCRGTHKCQN